MLFTLATVILTAAIFVFFSQEFIKLFKKIFSFRGAEILLPITVASWCVYEFNGWILWFLYYGKEVLTSVKSFLIHFIPFQKYASSIASIIILTVCSLGPVFLLNIWSVRKTYKPYPYPYLTSTLIWIVVFVLLEII